MIKAVLIGINTKGSAARSARCADKWAILIICTVSQHEMHEMKT
jgi:hypothetical protein